MTTKLKVKVTDVTDEGLNQVKEHSKRKIKEYVQKQVAKNEVFKYMTANLLIERKVTTKKILEYNHVCMNCGDVQEMGSYAIAQTAMGHRVKYTCECGHITSLPQIH
jgi:lysyl-tRNA synthetase class I